MRYDQEWHHYYGRMTSLSAKKILEHLQSHFPIRSAIEFGCGHAHWLEAAQQLGIQDIKGLDGPWTEINELRIPSDRFEVVDLEKPYDMKVRYDLAICMEVGEHLQESASETLVQSICRHADLVLFGAAIPLQGGFRHINEKWPSFWANHFQKAGFHTFDLVRPVFWMDTDLHYYYRQNALVYVRAESTELIERAKQLQRELLALPLIDLVHPEKYMDNASYNSIALKRMLPKLPRAVWQVIKRRLPISV